MNWCASNKPDPSRHFRPSPLLARTNKLAKPTPLPKGEDGARNTKLESPPPAATPAQPVVAQKPIAPTSDAHYGCVRSARRLQTFPLLHQRHRRKLSEFGPATCRLQSVPTSHASASSARPACPGRCFECSSGFERGRRQLENISAW